MVPELRQVDTEAPGRPRVEEADLTGVVRAYPVAVAEGDPAARQEVRFAQGGIARVARAAAPAGADGPEDDVVHHVAGQQAASDKVNYISGEGSPAAYLSGPPALAGGERGQGGTFALPSRRLRPRPGRSRRG